MEFVPTTHIAILQSENIVFESKKVFSKDFLQSAVFFSEHTIKKMVEEEAKRDSSIIIIREGQSLRSMSSGERKVALFKYLISLKPKTIIVENFYEQLDAVNRSVLEQELILASKKIKIIQIVRKEKEQFLFIDTFFTLNKNMGLDPFTGKLSSFFKSKENSFKGKPIPRTTTNYNYNYQVFVKLTDVVVSYLEKPILKNISWEIKLGEFWQLIGENGSGKTTLLSLITGDNNKAYGQSIILFDKLKGTEENIWEIKEKIGYFTSNITELFNKRHSVLHMVLSGFYDSIGLYVKPLDSHVKLAKEWLDLIGLSEKATKTFERLSLSEQRMVLIARAMVKHPPLLILDEPTSGLDRENVLLIVSLINKIAKETNTTIIYVSHTMENGLVPDKVYKLSKSASGSLGVVL